MRILNLFFISAILFSCDTSNEVTPIPDSCKNIIIKENIFQEIDDEQATIIEHEIIDDCLKLKIGISGCNEDHEVDMITDGGVDESLPVQINFVLRDNDIQECDAYFQIDKEFDLSFIRISLNVDEDVFLNFPLSNEQILFKK